MPLALIVLNIENPHDIKAFKNANTIKQLLTPAYKLNFGSGLTTNFFVFLPVKSENF